MSDYDLDRVQKFMSDGTFLLAWGTNGREPGEFDAPTGLAVDAQGRIFVADFYNHRIQVFDRAGSLIELFGSEGAGDGQLHYPTDAAIDSEGNIYVADAYNHRVQKWASDGSFLAVWETRDQPGNNSTYPAALRSTATMWCTLPTVPIIASWPARPRARS